MKQNTCNIIMICKGAGKTSDQTYRDKLVDYLSNRDNTREEFFSDEIVYGELMDTVVDLTKSVSAMRAFMQLWKRYCDDSMYTYPRETSVNIINQIMDILAFVPYMEGDRYINGFTQEQIAESWKLLKKER